MVETYEALDAFSRAILEVAKHKFVFQEKFLRTFPHIFQKNIVLLVPDATVVTAVISFPGDLFWRFGEQENVWANPQASEGH